MVADCWTNPVRAEEWAFANVWTVCDKVLTFDHLTEMYTLKQRVVFIDCMEKNMNALS